MNELEESLAVLLQLFALMIINQLVKVSPSSVTPDMLSAVNEYQGFCLAIIKGVKCLPQPRVLVVAIKKFVSQMVDKGSGYVGIPARPLLMYESMNLTTPSPYPPQCLPDEELKKKTK